jgi:hypothetical protein
VWEGVAGTFSSLADGRLKLEFHSIATMVLLCRPVLTEGRMELTDNGGARYVFVPARPG